VYNLRIYSWRRYVPVQARVKRWGNSLALRIPKAFVEQTQMRDDSVVDLTLEGEAIVVRPVKRNRRSLDELLAGITDDNLHDEVDFGPPVGKEML
jgi:antitoxin MazE